MIRRFWEWRLKVWRPRGPKILASLPDDWHRHPADFSAEIIAWVRSEAKVSSIEKKIESYRK